MITIGLTNVLIESAIQWWPIFYEDSREIHPERALGLHEHWYTKEVGSGLGAFDLSVLIYGPQPDEGLWKPIFHHSTGFIEWEDGNYTFNVETLELTVEELKKSNMVWWLAAAGVGLMAVVVAKRR